MKKRKYVIVRTYSAGVHFGELVSRKGKEVVLTAARRLWKWEGALSLSDVAANGISGGKVSAAVCEITLTEAIEIIAVAPKIEKSLREWPTWRQ